MQPLPLPLLLLQRQLLPLLLLQRQLLLLRLHQLLPQQPLLSQLHQLQPNLPPVLPLLLPKHLPLKWKPPYVLIVRCSTTS